MSEVLAWDHTMINVADVDEQIHRFAERGITFQRGGRHAQWGTENALGYFGLNYIELISVYDRNVASGFERDNASAVYDAAHDYAAGVERINTIAIRSTDIEQTHSRLAGSGIPVGDIVEGKRLDEQGHEITWSIFFVNDSIDGLPYPFFLQWPGTDSSRETALREQGLITRHAAGDLKAHRVRFAVPDVPRVAQVWSTLTGQPYELQHDGTAVIRFHDRELLFVPGEANHIVDLEFTGANQQLHGTSVSIGASHLVF